MATYPDEAREDAIVDLVQAMNSEMDTGMLIRKMPVADDDPDNEQFARFYSLVQAFETLGSADIIHRCDILKEILELNKDFNVDFPSKEYYIDLCRG